MLERSVVKTAAWLEIIAGSAFLAAPDLPCRLLFAAAPEGIATVLARFAGVGLLALGIACLPWAAARLLHRAALGLFFFNSVVAILFAWVGLATTLRGVLLWPVVALHTVIAAALLPQFLTVKIVGLAVSGQERTGKL